MLRFMTSVAAAGVCLVALIGALAPGSVAAHAALERSEPAAGTSLAEPPAEIRLAFTEPLESAYTGAELLDSAGEPVPGVEAGIAPDNDRELVLVPAASLADGNYTVVWRTLSAADGHTLQGYFGFAVGVEAAAVNAPPAAAGSDPPRALSRGLALLGLAAVLAMPLLMLAVLLPATRAAPGLAATLPPALRRYAVLASVLAGIGSLFALASQAAEVFPDASLAEAMVATLGDTRYGQLWLTRVVLQTLVIATVALALWGRLSWRRPALVNAAVVAAAAPLPFSLVSHAAARQEGRAAAVAADALHLLSASLWAGGLLVLAAVLLPAMRSLPVEERALALRAAVPRFSVIALAAWGVLVLSGLYAAWLQVGTVEALRTTAYGQSLALKLALLVPVLGLAAFHLAFGKRGATGTGASRFAITIVAEALIVVAVLLVVGRLIGLEPAREVFSARTPPRLAVPLAFAADDGSRIGRLTMAPGAAGANAFLLEIEGEPLPVETEGVLRFTPPNQEMGRQELVMPMTEPNAFRAEGSELALPGDWRVEAIVRAIGAFSWSTEVVIPLGQQPPQVPEQNPAPRFAPPAIFGMAAVALGVLALAISVAGRGEPARRGAAALIGAGAVAVGGLVVLDTRIPPPEPVLAALIAATPAPAGSPSAMTHEDHDGAMDHAEAMDHHASPVAGDRALPGSGTTVQGDGLSIALVAEPAAAGPVAVTITVRGDDGGPLEGARVVVLSHMPEMTMGTTETPAEETAPGHYEAAFVPLGMAGEWHLAVRVSPRTASTQVFTFAVDVP